MTKEFYRNDGDRNMWETIVFYKKKSRKNKDGGSKIISCGNPNSKKCHGRFLAGIILVAFFILIPLFKGPYYVGHDTKFHIANILSIESQIAEGRIPTSPISNQIGYGLGYGTRLFYPPLSHTFTAYVSAFFSSFGFTTVDCLKLVHFLMLSFSGVTMYFLSYRLTKSYKIAFFSGVIYMLFPYHISDIYARDSLAECFLFPFLPMILSGIYELLEGNTARFYPLFVIGYIGGICSHFTLMIYFTFLLSVFLLISWRRVFQKSFLLPFCIAAFCVLGSCAFFLSGMLENRFLADYVVFEPGEMNKKIAKTALWPFEYLNIFPPFWGGVKFHFPVVLCLLMAGTFLKRKQITFPKYSKNFLLFGCLAFFFSTKLFPWKWMPNFLQMIQFPWRFEVFLSMTVSLYAPLCLKAFKRETTVLCENKNYSLMKKYCPTLLLLLLLGSAYLAISQPGDETVRLDNIWWNGGMGWQKEYLPVAAKKNKEYLKNKKQTISFMKVEGQYKILENHMPELRFSITSGASASYSDTPSAASNPLSASSGAPCVIELPRIYYPGYQLLSEKGEALPLNMSSQGLLTAEIPGEGVYTLRYTGTFFLRTARTISVLTLLLGALGYTLFYRAQRS